MRKNLTKAQRLCRKRDISELFDQGVPFCGHVPGNGLKLLFVARQCSGPDQFFVSPVKRLGSAVRRNRSKRLQREFYRHAKPELRAISQRAALKALAAFCAAEPLQEAVSSDMLLSWEERMAYRWGVVVYSEARPLPDGRGIRPPFRPEARDLKFLGEYQRYQALLPGLEKVLRNQWLRFLRCVSPWEYSGSPND
ncbi:MAG: ribonuclease P protein component [Spirochaetota bacterium]